MLPRSRRGRQAVALAAAVVAGAAILVGVEVGTSGSPLKFTSGAGLASQATRVGQPVSYAAFLATHPPGYSYQVTHVSLIPLPGFRAPRMLGAVFLRTKAPPLQAFGYPPLELNGTPWPVYPLGRYKARSGTPPHRPELVLMYGLRGSQLGGYATAGIRISYVVAQRSYTTDIYNGALLFYYPRHQTRAQNRESMAQYSRMENRAATAMQKLPGVKAASGK